MDPRQIEYGDGGAEKLLAWEANGHGQHVSLLRSLVGALEADSAWLVTRESSQQAIATLGAWDPAELGEPDGWLSGRFVRRLLASDEAVLEFDPDQHRRAAPAPGFRPPVVYAIGAPLPAFGAPSAAICAGFAAVPERDPEKLLWETDLFAAVAALHLNDAGGFASMLRGGLYDSLTGCLTYGGLMHAIEAEIARSERRGHWLSCCFLDLDDFKEVNMRRGHLVGNRVLAAAGEALCGGIRTYDVVGRFGGDEFVVLFPETGGVDARPLAERLRRDVRSTAGAAAEMSVDVTYGVADWHEGMSAEDLLEHADRALRDTKAAEAPKTDGAPPTSPSDGQDGNGDPATELGRMLGERPAGAWWRL